MTPKPMCPACDKKPVTDGVICHDCGRKFREHINGRERAAGLIALIPELGVSAQRLDVIERSVHVREIDPQEWLDMHDPRALVPNPSPANLEAAELINEVRNEVSTWVRHMFESRGLEVMIPPEPRCPCYWHLREWMIKRTQRVTLLEQLQWLGDNIATIRQDQLAPEMLGAFGRLRAKVQRAVDREQPDLYAGPCDAIDIRAEIVDGTEVVTRGICGVDLYGNIGDKEVECSACGQRYSVQERKEWLLKEALDIVAVPTVIANALTGFLDTEVTPSMVRQMAFRREILPKRFDMKAWVECKEEDCEHSDPDVCDQASAKYYLVRDVLEVLTRRAQRKNDLEARRSRRSA